MCVCIYMRAYVCASVHAHVQTHGNKQTHTDTHVKGTCMHARMHEFDKLMDGWVNETIY